MKRWRNGAMEHERNGAMERWRGGVMEYRRNGAMEFWRNGVMEDWRNGVMEFWSPFVVSVVRELCSVVVVVRELCSRTFLQAIVLGSAAPSKQKSNRPRERSSFGTEEQSHSGAQLPRNRRAIALGSAAPSEQKNIGFF